MTTSDFKKMIKQLVGKPAKLKKYLKHNSPKKRTTGRKILKCERCGRDKGKVTSYGLKFCRQCFREVAPSIGFKKYS